MEKFYWHRVDICLKEPFSHLNFSIEEEEEEEEEEEVLSKTSLKII